MRPVVVAGVYSSTDAYPNVKYKIELLRELAGSNFQDTGYSVRSRLAYGSKIGFFVSGAKYALELAVKSLLAAVRIMRIDRSAIVYIPYPSIVVLGLLSFLPIGKKKIFISDMFISVYDTVVVDRNIVIKSSLVARALLWLERRVVEVCQYNLVDTPENAKYYAELLEVNENKFTYIPLSINESTYLTTPKNKVRKPTESVRVLYVGTLVPLHNIKALCDAIELVQPSCKVEFVFVGSGQQSGILEAFFERKKWAENIICHWEKQWKETEEILQEIEIADLCIGILGMSGKAQRVWPYKNYIYMACGKPIVTSESSVSQRLASGEQSDAFVAVDSSDARVLADTLMRLIENPYIRSSLGVNARALYTSELSHNAAKKSLLNLINDKLGV